VIHGAVRYLFQVLGAFAVGLLIAIPLLVWRLSSGPIALDFMTPYIEAALGGGDGAIRVKLEGTVLGLGETRHLLEIRALGVQIFTSGETPIATVPQLALTINGRALLRGELAPNSIRLHGLKVKLVRGADGAIVWGLGDTSDPEQIGTLVRRLVDALVGVPDPTKPGRQLQRAAVVHADLVIDDRARGIVWHSPDAEIRGIRTQGGLEVQASLPLDFGSPGTMPAVSARIVYRRDGDQVAGEVRLGGVRPAQLAGLGGPLAHLAALDLPLAGTISGHGTIDGGFSDLGFDLTADAGTIALPAPIDATQHVAGAVLRGRISNGFHHLDLSQLSLDLGGPTVSLAAVIDLAASGDATVKLDATAREIPFDTLPSLWPKALAPNPRAWVTSNMSKGVVHEAKASLSGRVPGGRIDDFIVDAVGGELRADSVTVDYLRPMPPVKNVSGTATFDAKQFRITLKGGELFGLSTKEGVVVLGGLDAPLQTADIDVAIEGPATDALKVIDHQPLHYAEALGIKPETVSGGAISRLKLKFPLLNDLRLDDIGIGVHVALKDVRVPNVLMGLDLAGANLVMDVDAKGLDANGPVVLGTVPSILQWRENFSSRGSAFRSRYLIKAARVDEAQRKLFGLEGPPFVAPWIDGPVGAVVTATLFPGGKTDIEAQLDLSPAQMSLPGLGWRKEARTTGGATALVKLDKGRLAAVPSFSVVAGDLQTKGSVSFTPEGKVRRVDFQRLTYGRTDIEGGIGFRPGGGMDVTAKGPSFDARSFVSNGDEPPPPKGAKKQEDLPPMSVALTVARLYLSKQGKLTNATASLARDDKDWNSVSLKGIVGDTKPFSAQVQRETPSRRAVKVTSDDAGGVMRLFDVYDDLVGGKLDITGAYQDDKPDQPVVGVIHVTDYSVVHAPALARLLTVAMLTGVVDVLQGQGVAFSTLDAPFSLTDGLLKVTDARAFGPALGLTAQGQIDLDHSRMALEGTVVPAYLVNSVLGHIPVVGWLFTGGEKGGGLVAFNFSMKGSTDDPTVVVNPLSALTPGFLRHLFNIFDDGSETDARQRK